MQVIVLPHLYDQLHFIPFRIQTAIFFIEIKFEWLEVFLTGLKFFLIWWEKVLMPDWFRQKRCPKLAD